MITYLTPDKADIIRTIGNCLDYPLYARALEQNPALGRAFLPTEGEMQHCMDPDLLVVEATHHLGKGPKKILDFGAGAGKNALYLAANGYSVVAVDPDKIALDFARKRVRDFNLPKGRFELRDGGIESIDTWETFDAVVATMVFDFMEEPEIHETVDRLSKATLSGGLHVVSAYTQHNPDTEITVQNKKHLFTEGELASHYNSGWSLARSIEGISPRAVQRSTPEGARVLLPNIAEVIAVKTSYQSSRMVLEF